MKNTMKTTLMACCLLLLAVPGFAQPVKAPAAVTHPQSSKLDLYAGYSYWAPHATINNFRYKSINEGFTLSAAYYFDPYVGGQFEVTRGQQTSNDGMRSFSGGLIVRAPKLQNIQPFAHALVGAIGLTGPNEASTNNGSSYFYNPERWGTMLAVGGGLDYPTPFLHHHLSIRLFQVDYQFAHVSFGRLLPTRGGRVNLDAAHLSAGLVYSFNKIHF